MKFLYLVLGALFSGILVGRYTGADFGDLSVLTLYLLIFIIGVDIGRSNALGAEIRKAGRISLILPISTTLGSLSGGIIASFLVGTPLKLGLAISAGFGWYSLTGPLLAQYSPLYGIIGFLANLTREIFTIIFYPLAIKKIPKELAVSMGGATTMDSTLPVLVKFGGREITVLAFIHGFILTALAPFLISLIMQL
ncbi:hypothetical protein A3L12_07365 [Thermococcus sp. P6]|uniref:lysine exporter LysO family protein n=1 Tax=Thermococcus sp. P6 TaxID=122420 RepID=UPI000B59BE85|nr:lysine exporter LysO family protein [Thermococcus sp. P6]ASJ11129.1 hypothetical protein A3L12_07365 [Thermococcus sp. P6]